MVDVPYETAPIKINEMELLDNTGTANERSDGRQAGVRGFGGRTEVHRVAAGSCGQRRVRQWDAGEAPDGFESPIHRLLRSDLYNRNRITGSVVRGGPNQMIKVGQLRVANSRVRFPKISRQDAL